MRIRVVAFGVDSTWESALGGANLFLAATRDFLGGASTSTLDGGFLVARIARSVMTERRALVFAAGQSFPAYLVTRRTLTVAALPIARMFAATSHVLALLVAVQRLVAGNFFG